MGILPFVLDQSTDGVSVNPISHCLTCGELHTAFLSGSETCAAQVLIYYMAVLSVDDDSVDTLVIASGFK